MNAMNLHALTARSAIIATSLAIAVLPGGSLGAAITWVPDADGFWDLATNWSSNPTLPGAGDDVTINVGGAVVRLITHRTGTTTIRTINNAETVDVTNASTLTISSGGLGSTNTGTLQANNGTLNLLNSALNNAGGTLSAINGGRINLSSGTVVTGGTLSTASSGAILTAVGTSATLNGVTLASGAQFIGSNASSTTLIGTINNGGTITLSSAGNLTDLVVSGTVTLTGSGGVLMGNGINNRIRGALRRLINDVGHTIQGAGQIGVDQIAITNAGLIVANQPAGMDINPNASGMINTGTVRATGGATLQPDWQRRRRLRQHRRHDRGAGRFDGAADRRRGHHRRHADDIGGRNHHDAQRRRGAGKCDPQRRDGLQREPVRRRIQQPDNAGGHDHQQRHDGAGLDRTETPTSSSAAT